MHRSPASWGRLRELRATPRTIAAVALVGVLVPLAGEGSATVPSPLHVDSGSSSGYSTKEGPRFLADRGFVGGRVYTARDSTTIAGTNDDALYRSSRVGMTGYRLPVPSAGTYQVDLHLVELQTGGRGKRVFDVLAEGQSALRGVDVYAQHGRYVAVKRGFTVAVKDGTLDLEFRSSSTLPAAVSAISVSRASATGAPAATPAGPTAPAAKPSQSPAAPPAAPPAADAARFTGFPTPETTGPRVPRSSLSPSEGITSSRHGEVIERKNVTGNIRIQHDNVVVRDSRVSFTRTYGLYVAKKADGSCPVGARFEHVELDGRLASEADVPVYSPGCPWTLDHAYVHDVGRAIKLTNDNVVSNSYIVSSRTGDSGSHRGAVGINGGRNNKVINNVLLCQGSGCSAAIPMYGDFAPVDGMLVQRNLLATTGSYCAYGGSLDSKRYPHGSNIQFIDNHFSTRYGPKCGRYGTVSSFAGGVRGNEARGNVWHETGQPVEIR